MRKLSIRKRKAAPLPGKYYTIAAGTLAVLLAVSGCSAGKLAKPQAAMENGSSLDGSEKETPHNEEGEKEMPETQKGKNSIQAYVTPQALLEAKNPYIGDAPANGKLLDLIWGYYGLEPGWTMELQTTNRPYGMILHLDQEPDNISMQKAAGLLMGLIDNCHYVSWDYPTDQQGNRAYYHMPSTVFNSYENIGWIKDYLQQEALLEEMEEFLALLERVDQPLPEKTRAQTLEKAVSAAILENNRYRYSQDREAFGEGHKLLGQEETKTTATVYALTMYGTYQFQDGNFVKAGGTGVVPVVIQMAKEPDGAYVALRYREPEDGTGYTESIQEMFPKNLWEQCLSTSDRDRDDLTTQERAWAESYLAQLGREAVIGDYGDFPHTILTEAGVPVEVSNALGNTRDFALDDPARFAPSWLGNIERLEDGERYIYEQSYDEENREIRFSKIRYETGEIVSQTVYDGMTGKKK